MLRLQDIPPEQMPEVVRVASELYEKDREQDAEARERQATVDAAAEIGLPEEYLHRAAAELHTRRVAEVQQRRRRNGLLAVCGAALALGTGGYIVTHLPVPTPPAVATIAPHTAMSLPFGPTHWNLASNPGTRAAVKFEKDAAILRVESFQAGGSQQYFANLNTFDGPKDLTGFRTVTFRVQGTLPQVRLYLENGGERWRSPALPVTGQEQTLQLNLDQFEYQVRADRNSPWKKDSYRPPTTVDRLSFKTGWYVNDANASGDVVLRDVRFE